LASIPNIAHISVALDLLSGRFDYRPLGLLDDTHLRFYTRKSILSLFRNSGYEVVLWERVIVKPEDTEFQTVLATYPASFLSFFATESESHTYQFIVKAVPFCNASEEVNSQETRKTILEELRMRVEEQEHTIRELKMRMSALTSITTSRSWRITAPIRMLVRSMRGLLKNGDK
jgi:hypothetical protein